MTRQAAAKTHPLNARIRELERDNRSLDTKLVGACAEIEQLRREADEYHKQVVQHAENTGFWKRQWADADKSLKEERAQRLKYEAERDTARNAEQLLKMELNNVEHSRSIARTVAEQMRQQAYPSGPRFPWEQRR